MRDTTTSGSQTSPLRKLRPAARAARTRGLGAGGIVRPGRGEPQPSGVPTSGWACTDGVSLSAHRLTVPEAITRIRRCGNLYTVLAHSEPRLAKTDHPEDTTALTTPPPPVLGPRPCSPAYRGRHSRRHFLRSTLNWPIAVGARQLAACCDRSILPHGWRHHCAAGARAARAAAFYGFSCEPCEAVGGRYPRLDMYATLQI